MGALQRALVLRRQAHSTVPVPVGATRHQRICAPFAVGTVHGPADVEKGTPFHVATLSSFTRSSPTTLSKIFFYAHRKGDSGGAVAAGAPACGYMATEERVGHYAGHGNSQQ